MTNEQIYLAGLQQLQQLLTGFVWSGQTADNVTCYTFKDSALSTIATALAAATSDDGAAKK